MCRLGTMFPGPWLLPVTLEADNWPSGCQTPTSPSGGGGWWCGRVDQDLVSRLLPPSVPPCSSSLCISFSSCLGISQRVGSWKGIFSTVVEDDLNPLAYGSRKTSSQQNTSQFAATLLTLTSHTCCSELGIPFVVPVGKCPLLCPRY